MISRYVRDSRIAQAAHPVADIIAERAERKLEQMRREEQILAEVARFKAEEAEKARITAESAKAAEALENLRLAVEAARRARSVWGRTKSAFRRAASWLLGWQF